MVLWICHDLFDFHINLFLVVNVLCIVASNLMEILNVLLCEIVMGIAIAGRSHLAISGSGIETWNETVERSDEVILLSWEEELCP
jgi:hypothetical protein